MAASDDDMKPEDIFGDLSEKSRADVIGLNGAVSAIIGIWTATGMDTVDAARVLGHVVLQWMVGHQKSGKMQEAIKAFTDAFGKSLMNVPKEWGVYDGHLKMNITCTEKPTIEAKLPEPPKEEGEEWKG